MACLLQSVITRLPAMVMAHNITTSFAHNVMSYRNFISLQTVSRATTNNSSDMVTKHRSARPFVCSYWSILTSSCFICLIDGAWCWSFAHSLVVRAIWLLWLSVRLSTADSVAVAADEREGVPSCLCRLYGFLPGIPSHGDDHFRFQCCLWPQWNMRSPASGVINIFLYMF